MIEQRENEIKSYFKPIPRDKDLDNDGQEHDEIQVETTDGRPVAYVLIQQPRC